VFFDGVNLYVTEADDNVSGSDNGNALRKVVISTAEVTTLVDSSTDLLYWPSGISTDGTSLFIADIEHHVIRKVQ